MRCAKYFTEVLCEFSDDSTSFVATAKTQSGTRVARTFVPEFIFCATIAVHMNKDYLYHEFCTSFPVHMSRHDDGFRDILVSSCLVPVVPVCVLNEGRRERLRARIARCTRAIFRTTQTPLPSKKVVKDFKAGVDAFLVYAFGDMFAPGSHWYENPHPYEFFYSLVASMNA